MADITLTAAPAVSLGGRARTLAGVALGLVSVFIWALWIVGTRQAVTSDLPLAWIGVLRFGAPAVLLLPFWWRHGLLPRGVDPRLVGLMVLGSGAPFLALVATGMRHAAAAEIGVLLPGTMPLFVAVLSGIFDRERFTAARMVGFALVASAAVAIAGPAILAGGSLGMLLIPAGAFLWAIFTIAFRRSGLSAVAAAGIIGAWSSLAFLPFALAEGFAPLFAVRPEVLGLQVLSQSILSGVVALVTYGASVRILGASRAAVLSALTMVFAALIAVPLLGEIPTPVVAFGIVLAALGVALGSGAMPFGRR